SKRGDKIRCSRIFGKRIIIRRLLMDRSRYRFFILSFIKRATQMMPMRQVHYLRKPGQIWQNLSPIIYGDNLSRVASLEAITAHLFKRLFFISLKNKNYFFQKWNFAFLPY
ncbi:MAG: hypothetical protein PHR36_03275, partial [Patescibacteria group bacterium]|nr:hypothetical protein [Patescibacteria group bacterium]